MERVNQEEKALTWQENLERIAAKASTKSDKGYKKKKIEARKTLTESQEEILTEKTKKRFRQETKKRF